jgi:hypothetical protein
MHLVPGMVVLVDVYSFQLHHSLELRYAVVMIYSC